MTEKRIQAPHKMKCEHCDIGFTKLVKTDELINGEKHCVYYCEHCKNYELYKQVERPKRFTNDAVDDFFEMEDYLARLEEENEQLKQQIKDLYKFVKYDVDNEIDVYPKSILEHLVNILKIIGDVE